MHRPVPKFQLIVNSILTQIISGKLKSGDRLEAERSLTDVYGVSLGTVQRAMDELVSRGVLVREVGRGSFIRGLGSSVDARYIRFQDSAGRELPVFWKILSVGTSGNQEAAQNFFGKHTAVTRIDRLVDIDHKVSMVSHFYLSRENFNLLMQKDDLKDHTNLRLALSERLAITALRLEQRFGFEAMSEEVAKILKPHGDQDSFVIEFRGYSESDQPLFLQRIIGKPSASIFFITTVRN
jgi:GntR family transcriptional regulator